MPRNRKVWPYEYRCPQCGAEYTAPEANRRKHVTKEHNPAYTETVYETGMRSRTLFPGQVPIPRGPRKVQVPASTSTIFHGYKCWDCEAILRKIDPSEQFSDDSDEDDADLENDSDDESDEQDIEQAKALKEKHNAEWEERWNCFIGKIVCHMEYGLGAIVRLGYEMDTAEVLIDFFELARPQNELGLRIVRLDDLNRSVSHQALDDFLNNATRSDSIKYPIEVIRSVMNNLRYGNRKQFLNSEIVSILKQVVQKSSHENEDLRESWQEWSANNMPPDFDDAKETIAKALRISRDENLTFQEASKLLENQSRR